MATELTPEEFAEAFAGLSEDYLIPIAEKLAPSVWAAMRANALPDAKNHVNVRFLHNGTEVTQDANGTTVGLTGGKGQFDIANFIGGSASINSASNARQIDFTMGGGADCLFDYLTSGCFATLPGFTEGMAFKSLSGCTFYGYSTIGGAMTAMAALGVGVNAVLAICGGTYNEQVSKSPPTSSNWDIIGAGSGRVNWAATGAGQTLMNFGTTSSGSRIRVRGIHFNLGAQTGCVGVTTTGNWIGSIGDCHFSTGGDATSFGSTITGALGGTFDDCTFSGSGVGAKGATTMQEISYTGCIFECATGLIINGNRIVIDGCIFSCSTKDISLGANVFEVAITGSQFNRGINTVSTQTCNNFDFTGNIVRLDSGMIGLDFSVLTVNSHGFTVCGNSFNGQLSNAIGIKLDPQMIDGMIGMNTFTNFTSGNEISGTGGGVTGAHNVSDAGAIADFGSPVGHWGTGSNIEHHVISAQVDVTVASTTVPYQIVGPMPLAGRITGVEAKSGENKTNGATSSIFDVHKVLAANANTDGQGTTIFTTQANRPTIVNGAMLSTTTLPDVTAFAAGDYFAIYTDQSGTTLTVANVGIKYTNP